MLGGWSLPLFSKATGVFLVAFLTRNQGGRQLRRKRGEVFLLGKKEEEVFIFILLILSFHQIVNLAGDLVFYICLCHPDINNGVGLTLPYMAYLEIPM